MREQIETGSFVSAPGVPVRPDMIRMISWNINRGEQLDAVLGFLSSAGPDLILLQETDVNAARTHYRNIAREIAQTLRMNYVFGCEFEELTQGDRHSPAYHGQATLSRLPLSASRIVRFGSQSGFWRPRWFIPKIDPFQRRLGARMALVSHVEWFEKQLVVYNVHLESRSSDALRYGQLAEIFNDARQHGSEVPSLIAGDFNLDLSGETVASMISGAKFNNPFHSGKAHQTTMPSRLRRSRAIDWILTRGPIDCADPDLHDSVCASDHYPLSLSLLCK